MLSLKRNTQQSCRLAFSWGFSLNRPLPAPPNFPLLPPLPCQVAINGERPWVDPDCPDALRRLITRCWHQDQHMRPSPAELMRLTEFLIQVCATLCMLCLWAGNPQQSLATLHEACASSCSLTLSGLVKENYSSCSCLPGGREP